MNKLTKISAVFTALLLFGFFAQSIISQTDEKVEIYNSDIVTLVVGALVGIVVAVALIPTIANQTTTLEDDYQDNATGVSTSHSGDTGDLDSAEEDLVGLWPLLIIVGVMMAIIGSMLI